MVIDEFPFLVKASPGLPSITQRELGPGGSGSASRTRLLLCGSAMSVMGGLLSGSAPLRGRAGLELIVHPFGYRDAARFWDITDPKLAVLVHSVVGGTPAYRRELLREDTPADLADFDPWVIRTVLNPQTPLFREGRYLLAEETEIRDPSLYHPVLAAVAEGNNTSGGIASYIGRKSNEVAHPLRVLEDSRLLIKEPDLFRSGRARYRIAEPLITFFQAIMSREWARLELGGGSAVSTRPSNCSAPTRPTPRAAGPRYHDAQNGIALHQRPQIPGSGGFYPDFYPKRQRNRVVGSYFLVTAANWSDRPECATSLPSWSAAAAMISSGTYGARCWPRSLMSAAPFRPAPPPCTGRTSRASSRRPRRCASRARRGRPQRAASRRPGRLRSRTT